MKNNTPQEQEFLQKTGDAAPKQWSKPQLTQTHLDKALSGGVSNADGTNTKANTQS